MTRPTVLTKQGLQPTSPAAIRAALVAAVAATNPDYTANLPGSLIEDIASTDTFAIALCDAAMVETVNSLTPYGANAFVLNQLGQIYGVQPGAASNTSAFVVFTGTPGFVIAQGFTVSDGTHQYTVRDGGIVPTGGSTSPLFCVATVAGSWAVPAATITTLITSVPGAITLAVTNPNAGLPAESAETEEGYRARVLQAGLSPAMGFPTLLKTLLGDVSGVQSRLISTLQQGGGGWEVIVGGGDPYDVAYAIFTAMFDVSTLVGASAGGTDINVSINDYPDTFNVTYVDPVQQAVAVQLTWNTTVPYVVSTDAVAQLGSPAILSYINSIPVGAPINVFEMENAFAAAIETLIPTPFLTRMVWTVSIDGTPTSPTAGTFIIVGDAEGYFLTDAASVSIAQG